MYMEKYFKEMKLVLEKVEKTQQENILKAADVIVDSITNDGMWHIYDTGHMLMFEGVGRTGGMMALRPIRINCDVSNPTRYRNLGSKLKMTYDMVEGFADFVLGQANITKGDVLMIGTVSGYNYFPIDLALKARKRGIKTIAITTVEYSKKLTSKHPSKLRLFEAVDIVLDNCSNFGDTLVYVDEIKQGICPASGISASYILWALQSAVVEKLVKKGLNPSIYISNHMEKATEKNKEARANYEKYGF